MSCLFEDPYASFRKKTHNGTTSNDGNAEPLATQTIRGSFLGGTGLISYILTTGSATIQIWLYDGDLDAWVESELFTISAGKKALKTDTAGQVWGITVPSNSGTLTINGVTVSRTTGGN